MIDDYYPIGEATFGGSIAIRKRGIVEECCMQPCSLSHLESYCCTDAERKRYVRMNDNDDEQRSTEYL